MRPDAWSRGRSTCVTSPVTTTLEPKPRRVRNICICSGLVFCASSRMMKRVVQRAAAHEGERRHLDHAALHVRVQLVRVEHVVEGVEERAQVRVDLREHVARQEAEPLAGLDGRAREDDAADLPVGERGDGERHREVRLARAGRADPEGHRALADRVDVALLRHRLRRDLLAAVAPDDVVEDLAEVLRLVERRHDGADRVGADLVARPRRARRARPRPRGRRRPAPSSPSIVSWLPRSRSVHWSRARSASSTPSPTPASSAATSFGTERTSCTHVQCRRGITRLRSARFPSTRSCAWPTSTAAADVHARIRGPGEGGRAGATTSLDIDDLDDDAAFARARRAARRSTAHPGRRLRALRCRTRRSWVRSAAYSAIAGGRTVRRRLERARDEALPPRRLRRELLPPPRTRPVRPARPDGDPGSRRGQLERRHDRREGGGVPRRPRRARRAADGRRPHPSRRRRAAGRRRSCVANAAPEHPGRPRAARRGVAASRSIDIDFFRELGRIVEPGEHPSPTIVGSRALAVDAVVSGADGGAAEVDPARRRRGRRQDDAHRRGAPPRRKPAASGSRSRRPRPT